MSTGWLVNTLLGTVLLPPLNLLLLCASGFALRSRWPRAGLALSLVSLMLLALLGMRPIAGLLISPLEHASQPLSLPYQGEAQAIVVLGGGRRRNAPEYGGMDVVNAATLQRLRYAAVLQRSTGLPLLVTGGRPDGAAIPEAEIMARSLREDFGVTVRWQENAANNTADNAQYAAAILRQQNIKHVLLVTDAIHMPRALQAFSKTGLQVTVAPTGYLAVGSMQPADYLPRAHWLTYSSYALHEWIGRVWYWLRY